MRRARSRRFARRAEPARARCPPGLGGVGPPSRRRRRLGTPARPGRAGITRQPAPGPGRLRRAAFLTSRAYSPRRAPGSLGPGASPARNRSQKPAMRPAARPDWGALDRRRAGDGAVVARPVPGSAPKRWRQGSAGNNGPRQAQRRPRGRKGNEARSLSPLRPLARSGREPAARRDRSSAAATAEQW